MRVTYLKYLPKGKKVDHDQLSALSVYSKPLDCQGVRLRFVADFGEYVSASVSKSVDAILITTHTKDGSDRIQLINELSLSGSLSSDKQNWLYGLPNPAELSIYTSVFSGYVASILTHSLCESAFQYAMYGARFSRTYGVLEYIEPKVFDYEPCHEQMRALHYNIGIVGDFLSGTFPTDYAEKLHAILEDVP